jgi:hypothetical protein
MAPAAAVSLWSREVSKSVENEARPAPGNGGSPLSVELVSKEAKRLVDGHAEVLDVFLCHLAGAEIPKEAQV